MRAPVHCSSQFTRSALCWHGLSLGLQTALGVSPPPCRARPHPPPPTPLPPAGALSSLAPPSGPPCRAPLRGTSRPTRRTAASGAWREVRIGHGQQHAKPPWTRMSMLTWPGAQHTRTHHTHAQGALAGLLHPPTATHQPQHYHHRPSPLHPACRFRTVGRCCGAWHALHCTAPHAGGDPRLRGVSSVTLQVSSQSTRTLTRGASRWPPGDSCAPKQHHQCINPKP